MAHTYTYEQLNILATGREQVSQSNLDRNRGVENLDESLQISTFSLKS